jgi:hypothetical protein
VDEDQISDRIDDALEFFSQFHVDGTERVYLSHVLTQADIDRSGTDTTSTGVSGSVTSSWTENNSYIVLPDSVQAILGVWHPASQLGGNWFETAQLQGTGLLDLNSSSDLVSFDMMKTHIDMLDHLFNTKPSIRFNENSSRLFIDHQWSKAWTVGDTIVIECYRKSDPSVSIRLYNDIFLKQYATELIKKQWGQNLQKFKGIAMIGGVEIDADTIYSQSTEAIIELEEKIKSTYQAPLDFLVG